MGRPRISCRVPFLSHRSAHAEKRRCSGRLGEGFLSVQAMTLIELLFVVVILAILASLVGQGIGRYRERMRLIQCGANLRGLGTALHIYATEADGQLPNLTPDSMEIPIPAGHVGGMDIRLVLFQYDPILWRVICPSDPRRKTAPDELNPWFVSYFYLQERGLDLGNVTTPVCVIRDGGFFHGKPGSFKSSLLFSDQHMEMESW